MTLYELGLKYGTDKAQHGYLEHYEKLLPRHPVRLLEIGCYKGASLRMWREWFPECELHTLDLFVENEMPTDIEGLICHKGNQSDLEFLIREFAEIQFDAIIDDGSHNAIDIENSLKHLFYCNLSNGGVYAIEDLHCLREESYRYVKSHDGFPLYLRDRDTLLSRMKYGAFLERHTLFNDKIAFIYK